MGPHQVVSDDAVVAAGDGGLLRQVAATLLRVRKIWDGTRASYGPHRAPDGTDFADSALLLLRVRNEMKAN